jgi:hypothetical protein
MFTTAGIVFFTISENPWAHAGGTPEAETGDTHPLPIRAETANPQAMSMFVVF